jgi:hypothetical protein
MRSLNPIIEAIVEYEQREVSRIEEVGIEFYEPYYVNNKYVDIDGDEVDEDGEYYVVVQSEGSNNVTLLRSVTERNCNGVPYLSDGWLPENAFPKPSVFSEQEQIYMLKVHYLNDHKGKEIRVVKVFFEDE